MTKWLDREMNEVGEDSLTPYPYPLYQVEDETLPLTEQQGRARIFYAEQIANQPPSDKAAVGDIVNIVLESGEIRPAIVVAAVKGSLNDSFTLNIQTIYKKDGDERTVRQETLRYSLVGEGLTWHRKDEVTEKEQERIDREKRQAEQAAEDLRKQTHFTPEELNDPAVVREGENMTVNPELQTRVPDVKRKDDEQVARELAEQPVAPEAALIPSGTPEADMKPAKGDGNDSARAKLKSKPKH